MTTLLISANNIREWCGLAEITNEDKRFVVMSAIRNAQNVLRSKLCYTLYDELVTQYETSTLTVANQALLERVQIYLAYLAFARYANQGTIFDTDAGFVTHLSDESTPASPEEIKAFREMANQDAMFYEVELLNFIKDNIADYPLAGDCNSICGKQSRRLAYSFPISGAGMPRRPLTQKRP